nr:hypothetical protein [Escherichia coli O25b:H4-ST131]
MATAFLTRNHRREQAPAASPKGKEADLALCFNQHIDGIQPLKTVAAQFFCGQDGENRRSDSDILRLRSDSGKRTHTDIQPACYLMAFFGLRHRPPWRPVALC